jgi:hypothetical protein
MLAAASSFVGLTEKSREFSLTPPISKFSVVGGPAVGAAGCIAVDTAAASSIAAAPSLRTAMITSELLAGIPAKSATDML